MYRKTDQKIPAVAPVSVDFTEPVRSLAHDLRTPLTSLQSCLDLVLGGQTGPLNADQQRFLGMARRNIDRLDRMLQDMLTRVRLPEGPAPAARQEVDLGPLLREITGLHRITAVKRGLDLDDSGLPESFTARVDPDLVARILDNVLGNALKFTGVGGRVRVRLEAGARHTTGLAGRLARHCGLSLSNFNLIVEDNGPGLSAAVRSRIFEPYNRGESAAGVAASGTGLGLSIIRRLVDAQGGQVRLISLPGRGTTVWLKLPGDPATEHFQKNVARMTEVLARDGEHGVKPLVGILDLRRAGPGGEVFRNMEDGKGFFGREASGHATAWELVPGLWTAAVLDPVNWSRRWTLFAARTGGGLESTHWEYLAGRPQDDLTVTGHFEAERETMVNLAPEMPNTS